MARKSRTAASDGLAPDPQRAQQQQRRICCRRLEPCPTEHLVDAGSRHAVGYQRHADCLDANQVAILDRHERRSKHSDRTATNVRENLVTLRAKCGYGFAVFAPSAVRLVSVYRVRLGKRGYLPAPRNRWSRQSGLYCRRGQGLNHLDAMFARVVGRQRAL